MATERQWNKTRLMLPLSMKCILFVRVLSAKQLPHVANSDYVILRNITPIIFAIAGKQRGIQQLPRIAPDNIRLTNPTIWTLEKIIRIFVYNTRTMTTKLTLTVEKTVIEKAKSYAKRTGRSLSEIIEKYLESITNEEKNNDQLSPKLKKIVGAVKLPKNFDEEKELRAYLEKKHL